MNSGVPVWILEFQYRSEEVNFDAGISLWILGSSMDFGFQCGCRIET